MTSQNLIFELCNAKAPKSNPDVVYSSTDSSDNQLSLIISTDVDTTLMPGTVVDIDDVGPNSGSLFYLYFTNLGMTDQEFNNLTIERSAWNYQLFTSGGTQIIGFGPVAQQGLAASKPISISLNNFTLSAQPKPGTLTLKILYFHVDQFTSGDDATAGLLTVTELALPNSGDLDLHQAMGATLKPETVVNCPVGDPLLNNLTLILSAGESLPPPGPKTIFTLSFVYAEDKNGFGAMMTREQAGKLMVAAGPLTDWTIVANTAAESPNWTLTPTAGKPIIGQGVDSSKSILITGLVTNFQPGPTVVFLAYQNVPGYQDGVFSIPVLKDPHVEIQSLTVVPDQQVLVHGRGQAEVTVSWQATDYTSLKLQPIDQDVTNLTSWSGQIDVPTTIKLDAEGDDTNVVDNTTSRTCTIDKYNGMFMRQYAGQIANWDPPGTAWNKCPDIIAASMVLNPASILSEYDNPGLVSLSIRGGPATIIYVTGVNTADQPMDVRVWMFWTLASTRLSPSSWRSDGLFVAGQTVNYQQLTLAAAHPWVDINHPPTLSPPGVTAMPFIFTHETPFQDGDEVALIVLVENEPGPDPVPPLPTEPFGSPEDLGDWIVKNGNVGWLDTTVSVQDNFLSIVAQVAAVDNPPFYLGAETKGISPNIAEIEIHCPGPDWNNSLAIIGYSVQMDPCIAIIPKPLTWPEHFMSSLVINVDLGDSTIPGATVWPVVSLQPPRSDETT